MHTKRDSKTLTAEKLALRETIVHLRPVFDFDHPNEVDVEQKMVTALLGALDVIEKHTDGRNYDSMAVLYSAIYAVFIGAAGEETHPHSEGGFQLRTIVAGLAKIASVGKAFSIVDEPAHGLPIWRLHPQARALLLSQEK
jgi:hypothetical protein